MNSSVMPLISVVVAVKNGEKTLAKCLKSVYAQAYRPLEIIIINDGSTDATAAIAGEFAKLNESVTVMATEGAGPSAARNMGILIAKGAYIAFTDGDCICMPDWLTKLAECIVSGPKVAGAGGDQQSPGDDTPYGKFINDFMKIIGFVAGYVKGSGINGIVPTLHNPSCNVIYRKEIFDEVGMFLPGLWPGEDVDLDHRILRAGYQLRYTPEAVVLHYRPSNISAFARMMYRYGHAQARLIKMHGMFRLIHFVPVALFIAVVLIIYMIIKGFLIAVFALCLCAAVLPLIYFIVKARSFIISLRCWFHLTITLLCWNAGFIDGLAYRLAPKDVA